MPVIASSNSVMGTDLDRSCLSIYDINNSADFVQKMIDLALCPDLQKYFISNSQVELKQFDSSLILPQWLQLLNCYLHHSEIL